MKVILLENHKKLGIKGTVVKTSNGYAWNYLIPQKLAVSATTQTLKNLNNQKAHHKQKLKDEAKHWLDVKHEIEKDDFKLIVKVNEKGALIGKVSKKHILDLINKKLSDKITKTMVKDVRIIGIGLSIIDIELFTHIKAEARINVRVR